MRPTEGRNGNTTGEKKMKITTAGLTALLRSMLEAHDDENRPSRVRAITSEDASEIARAARRAIRAATPEDVSASLTIHGGFVANSYKYTPRGDRAELVIDLRPEEDREEDTGSPRFSFTVSRGYAAKRPALDIQTADRIIIRLQKEGQTQGRIVK
jgi:hypothetical protein